MSGTPQLGPHDICITVEDPDLRVCTQLLDDIEAVVRHLPDSGLDRFVADTRAIGSRLINEEQRFIPAGFLMYRSVAYESARSITLMVNAIAGEPHNHRSDAIKAVMVPSTQIVMGNT